MTESSVTTALTMISLFTERHEHDDATRSMTASSTFTSTIFTAAA